MIVARPHPNSITTRSTCSRVAVYKIPEFNLETVPDTSVALEKVGEWLLEADATTVGFVAGHSKLISIPPTSNYDGCIGGLMLAYINDHGHAVISPLNMLPPPPGGEIGGPEEHNVPPAAPSLGMIPIPNPFKAFKPRETTGIHVKPQRQDGRLLVGAQRTLGPCWDWSEADQADEEISGMKAYAQGLVGSEILVVIWTPERVLVSLDDKVRALG